MNPRLHLELVGRGLFPYIATRTVTVLQYLSNQPSFSALPEIRYPTTHRPLPSCCSTLDSRWTWDLARHPKRREPIPSLPVSARSRVSKLASGSETKLASSTPRPDEQCVALSVTCAGSELCPDWVVSEI